MYCRAAPVPACGTARMVSQDLGLDECDEPLQLVDDLFPESFECPARRISGGLLQCSGTGLQMRGRKRSGIAFEPMSESCQRGAIASGQRVLYFSEHL